VSTWVLLRGLTRERAHWGAFPALLEQALPGVRVVTVDLPGAGGLRQLRCPGTVAAMVPSCRRQLEAAGVVPPYHLLGLSLGGMVAMAWSLAQPEEVAGAVLVNTSMRPFSPPQHRLRLAQLPLLARLLLPRDPLRAEQTILRLTSACPARHAAVVDNWVAIRRARPVAASDALRQLLAAARYCQPGQRPTPPMLVVCSMGDGLVNPRCSLELADRLALELACHPEAGHDLPLDDGQWLVSRLLDWVTRHGLGDPATPWDTPDLRSETCWLRSEPRVTGLSPGSSPADS
jgi:pimeloyl-ACP methyl ester carboxylesterase